MEQRGQRRKTSLRSVGAPNRHRTVYPHDRGLVEPGQGGVEVCDQRPARLGARAEQGDRGVQAVGTGGVDAGEQQLGVLDRGAVPPVPVLPVVGDQPPLDPSRGPPGVVQQHEREERGGLTVVGQHAVNLSSEPDRLLAQLEPVGRVRVALGEQQVHNGADLVDPPRQVLGGRHLEPDAGVPDLGACSDQPLGEGRNGHEHPCGHLAVRQPDHVPQRQRDLGLSGQGGVAAGEHEGEHVVGGRDRVAPGMLIAIRSWVEGGPLLAVQERETLLTLNV